MEEQFKRLRLVLLGITHLSVIFTHNVVVLSIVSGLSLLQIEIVLGKPEDSDNQAAATAVAAAAAATAVAAAAAATPAEENADKKE